MTLDDYCRKNELRNVDLCKIDAEGSDFLVLEGGMRSLKAGVFRCVQFECNHRWIYARHYLKDVFDMASDLDLEVGKLTPRGIERYQRWHPELESFREGNYVMVAELENIGLQVFPWWG